jgi:two-component system response regulator YesN
VAPDLVLTDIRMPGLTGLELIEKIRERDQDAEVIIISGYSEFDYAQRAIRFGVTDYLLKPIKEPQLREAVEIALKRHENKRLQKGIAQADESREASMIHRLKACVAERYGEPSLTLKWIANNVLFMNVDYVSRRFVAETGEKFSAYLMHIRMERAKQLFGGGQRDIQHVAEQVGCGNSQRYFSQVFKKYVGLSPTQYLAQSGDL